VGRCTVVADHHGIDLGADAPDAVSITADRQQLEVLLDNLRCRTRRDARPPAPARSDR
jgi:hypothetical protein